jgi:hypothetical protein
MEMDVVNLLAQLLLKSLLKDVIMELYVQNNLVAEI